MQHSTEPHRIDLEREHIQNQMRFLRRAVEDATYELYRCELSFRESEALTHEIASVKLKISQMERRLLDPNGS